MRNNKRVLFLFVVVFMLLVTLVSCGSKKPSHVGSYGNGMVVITETDIKLYKKSGEFEIQSQYRIVDSSIIMVYTYKSGVRDTKTGEFIDVVRYTDEELDEIRPYLIVYLTDEGNLMVLPESDVYAYQIIRRDK